MMYPVVTLRSGRSPARIYLESSYCIWMNTSICGVFHLIFDKKVLKYFLLWKTPLSDIFWRRLLLSRWCFHFWLHSQHLRQVRITQTVRGLECILPWKRELRQSAQPLAVVTEATVSASIEVAPVRIIGESVLGSATKQNPLAKWFCFFYYSQLSPVWHSCVAWIAVFWIFKGGIRLLTNVQYALYIRGEYPWNYWFFRV